MLKRKVKKKNSANKLAVAPSKEVGKKPNYKIIKIVRAFSLVDTCLKMRVCKPSCDVTLFERPSII